MTCPICKADNPESNRFCANCGAPLGIDADAQGTHLRAQVLAILDAQYKDQRLVQVDLIENITTRLISWAKLFASLVGIPLSVLALVLGFLGIKATLDFSALNDSLAQMKKESDSLTKDLSSLREQRDRLNQLAADLQTVSTKVENIEEKVSTDPSLDKTPEGQRIKHDLEEFQKYFHAIGLVQPKGELKVSLDTNQKDNAYYQLEGNQLIIGEALASDPDVIYHEYSFRALTAANPDAINASWFQVTAISYGLADYFTCSYTNDAKVAEKSAPVFRETMGRERVPNDYLRNLDNNRSFSEVKDNDPASNEPHNVGEIWGGAFWEIRKLINNRDITDKLLFSAWAALKISNSPQNDAVNFVNTLIEKDRAIEGGTHADQIKEVFSRRGMRV